MKNKKLQINYKKHISAACCVFIGIMTLIEMPTIMEQLMFPDWIEGLIFRTLAFFCIYIAFYLSK